MRPSSKLYLGAVIGSGAILTALSLVQLTPQDSFQFAALLALALLGSGMKVRLPGVGATMSINFLANLIAAVLFSAPEAVLIAAVSGAAQTLFRAKSRARAVQVAFNSASLALSVTAAWVLARSITLCGAGKSGVAAMVAAAAYYVINSLLVCGVVALTQSKPFFAIWDRTYWLSLPYYMSGAALVFLAQAGGQPSFIVLPVMLLSYKYYEQWISREGKRAEGAA